MLLIYLINLGMGGGGAVVGTDLPVYPDPFAATVVTTVDPFGSVAKLKGS